MTANADVEAVERILKGLPADRAAALLAMPAVKARIGATCKLTPKQQEAQALLRGPAMHVMLFGGSRSGKTHSILRTIAERSLTATCRHAILRHRFNHLKASIIFDSWPKMMGMCFPNAGWKLDKSDWRIIFDSGSEVWFGGLDDKDRTEKVLGQEYAGMMLNECSQIALNSRDIALTRLAQKVPGIPLKMFYDANPPSRRHWTHQLFIDRIHPARHQPLVDPHNYVALLMNPEHNKANLPPDYIDQLEQLDERKRARFLLGIFSGDDENALWTPEMLDEGRLLDGKLPDMQRVVIAVDPSGCRGVEDLRSDEVGIVAAGLGVDGHGYVLEDLSTRAGPDQWKMVVASAYYRWEADCVVGETNYGGAMVGEVIKTATTESGLAIPFREVTASRGKVVRAEPIAALFEQRKVSLVGRLTELEFQLCSMTTAGYMGDKSPDRADAMVWALSALFPAIVREGRRRDRPPPRVVTSVDKQQHQARLHSGLPRLSSGDVNHGYVPRDERPWPARKPNVIRSRPR